MKNTLFSSKAASFFAIILSVFFVVTLVQASTTISTNIATGGTLTVGATSTLNTLTVTATSTSGAIGLGTLTPSALLDVGGLITQPPASLVGMSPAAYISSNVAGITGVVMGNTNAGGLGDFRFVITDRSNDYITMAMPDEGFSFQSLLGQVKNTAAFIFTNGTSTPRNLAIGTVSANHVIFGTNNTERMRITSVGNVGIGTSTPGAQLQVATSTANATSSVMVGKTGQNKGSCLVLFDSAGAAVYAYVAAGATTLTLSSTSCL